MRHIFRQELMACPHKAHSSLLVYRDGKSDVWGLADVLKALKLLDGPRQCRALERKIVLLEAQGAKASTVGALRSKVNKQPAT